MKCNNRIIWFVIVLQLTIIILMSGEVKAVVKNAKKTRDVYDVILFWGQSNMVGSANDTGENRIDLNNDGIVTSEEIKEYSRITGIDEDIVKKYYATGKRNQIATTDLKANTAFVYDLSTNSLKDLKNNSKGIGEYLYYEYNLQGSPTKLVKGIPNKLTNYNYATEPSRPNTTGSKSTGVNMIPQFCKTYYEQTGHKVVVVMCAKKGSRIESFLPYNDVNHKNTDPNTHRFIYEATKAKWEACIDYMTSKGYNIGKKMYIAFQGEQNAKYLSDSTDNYTERSSEYNSSYKASEYYNAFLKVHNYLTGKNIKRND